MPQKKIHFTLVHGTFARHAEWVRPGSYFREFISAWLGKDNVEFNSFFWSGRNSVTARWKAAHELREFLRGTLVQCPDADHYVIGHSHGGSVAFKALEPEPIVDQIKGLVCLSTPFVNPRPRTSMASLLSSAGLMCLASWGIVAVIETLLPFLAASLWRRLLIYSLLGWFLTPFAPILDKWFQRRAFRLKKLMEFREQLGCRVLLLRSFADEATGALLTAQFATWIGQQVVTAIQWPVSKVRIDDRRVWILLICAVLSLWIVFVPLKFPMPLWERAAVITSGAFAFTILLPVLLFFYSWPVASIVLTAVGVVQGVVVGWDAALASFALDISVESAPPGRWEIETISDKWDDAEQCDESVNGPDAKDRLEWAAHEKVRKAGIFYHGSTHDDRRALETICDWVQSPARTK